MLRSHDVIDRTLLMIRLSLVWLALTMLGAVVFGTSPASCAAADVLLESRRRARVRVLPMMWQSYRREFLRANVRMMPLLVVLVSALIVLRIVGAGLAPGSLASVASGVLAAMSGAWAMVSLSAIAAVPRVRRQDLLTSWRLALLIPGAVPLRSIAVVLGLIVWTTICSYLWPLALLLGPALAIEGAVLLLSARVAGLLDDVAAAGVAER